MRKILLLSATLLLWAADASAKIAIEPPPELPANVASAEYYSLSAEENSLRAEFQSTQAKIDAQAGHCSNVEAGSPQASDCVTEGQAVVAAVRQYRANLARFKEHISAAASWKKYGSGNQRPHAIAIESHGEFGVYAANGRKLTDDEIANLTLKDGVRMVTGKDGEAYLTLEDNSRIRIASDSVFLPKAPPESGDTGTHSMMELAKGSLRWLHDTSKEVMDQLGKSSVQSERERNIRLVTMVAAVRGTEFDCGVQPDGSGYLKLYSGEVSLTPKKGKAIILKPGQMVTFNGNKMGAVTQIPAGQ